MCPYWEERREDAIAHWLKNKEITQDEALDLQNKNTVVEGAGYCHYLKTGDWFDDGTLLLWDMCKECGINHDE